MGIIKLLKPALFIYECARIIVVSTYMVFQGNQAGFPVIAFAAPSALFPLIALFIWLDASRYRVYLPLFVAGKILCILSLLVWFLVFRQNMIIYSGNTVIELLLACGDLFSIAIILLIMRDVKKASETQALEV
jgi:hypothetical protein